MGFLLKPVMLENAVSAADVQKLMKSDLKNNAGKSGVKFVAAKNCLIGGKTVNLFIVTDNPTAFENIIKAKHPKALRAKGTCDLANESGKIKVTVKTSSGQMLSDGIAKMLPEVVAHDTTFVAEAFKPGAVNPNKAKALDLATKSHAEARQPSVDPKTSQPVKAKLDWPDFKPDAASVDALSKVALETAEYQKFADAYEKLAVKYKFNTDSDYKKVPVNIWHDLLKSLAESGYITKNIPKVGGDDRKLIFAYKSPEGKMVREAMLKTAMDGMQVYIQHAAKNLDKVVNEVSKNGTKTWTFWSGEGAKDAAKKEAGGGVVLEGSIGSWFDNVWKFDHLTGVNDMLLWNSMSELYARKAAENYEQFKFKGFIGPGGSRDTTVFVNIERPTLIEVLNVQKRVAVPPIQWFVVDCVADATSRTGWRGTGQPSQEFPTRQAALAEVVKRYKE